MRPKNSKQIILKCWDAEPWYAEKAHEHSYGYNMYQIYAFIPNELPMNV